jgi:DNA-binding NtrC family response regulator
MADDANVLTTRTIARTRDEPAAVHVRVVSGPSAPGAATGPRVTVGRSRAADLCVADPTISEFHLDAVAHAEGIELRDLDSWNGTYLDGTRILRAIVAPGTVVSLGESTIRLDASPQHSSPPPPSESFGGLLGKSRPMQEVFAALEVLAQSDLSVLVEGPTGSGKELAARALHSRGARAKWPFVVLDCAAIPGQLAESVLFGHERGSFTGAVEARPGVFEVADGGTVFLDEIGELPLELQPRLLRALDQRAVSRVGSNAPRPFSVRVVSATWRDLRRMVNQGHFREDLYYRLAQVRVVMPALRDRREDIELLAADFLRRLPREAKCARSLARGAIDELKKRDFPGNVRELKNTVEVAAWMAEGPAIRPADLTIERLIARRAGDRGSSSDEGGDVPAFKAAKRTAVDDFEHRYLERLLVETEGNIAKAAGLAGIERHHLRALLKRHGLHPGSR